MIHIKTKKQIETMRRANRIVAQTLRILKESITPGITTGELDKIAEKEIRSSGATPTFLGYRGYPASVCISINEEVVHGIPGQRVIKEGDVVSMDLGTFYEGFCGDSALTVAVGEIPEKTQQLISVTQEALERGINAARVGNRLYDISAAIQRHVEDNGFSVVRQFVGHGIGQQMHEDPQIPNYGKPGTGVRLKEGMVFAIEPMVNIGGWEVKVLDDDWTVVTLDGSLSAHFEHTIAVTSDGPDILSSRD
ncbi:MAG: type I methionyl aminopeptidase [Deltaproteobacteria bacterium]|nr:type I methionyl aminopeptidase [Candidatus Zymogenaceae bacterium]